LNYGTVNTSLKKTFIVRPRVLHLITSLDVGGTETMLLRTLPLLEKHFNNHVCAIRGRGKIGKRLEKAGIPVYYLDYNNVIDLTSIWRFWRLVQTIHPTLLITYLIHADLFGRVLGRLFGIPLVISSQRGSPLQWEFLRTFDRLTTELVDLYTVQTEVAKQQYGKNIATTGVKESLGLTRDSFLITCVSHLRRGKGQSYLLSAFEKIAAHKPNLHLLLIDEGEEKHSLEKQIESYQTKKQIHMIGARSDIPSLLAASDVFVMPTLAEGMSNAILEAMATSLPCLVSNIEVNREVIKHENTGLLFQVKNSQAIADAISRILSDKDLRDRLGKNARANILQHHDIQVLSETLANTYRQLINAQHPLPIPAEQKAADSPVKAFVSIVMSVYNGADTLDMCISSITNQTYQNFELICINDASTDSTADILKRWQQILPNLTVINNQRNIGLTKSLNKGLSAARGSLIARIDADDEWESSKLAKQVAFLDNNPEYGLIGCYYINTRGTDKYFVRLPSEDFEIRQSIFSMNPFGHSCIVARKELLAQVGGYSENIHYGQDLDLWFRLLPLTKMVNIDEFLCTRRTDRGISISKSRQQMLQSIKTTIRYIRRYGAPRFNYLWLARPLAVILTPQFVKRMIYIFTYPAPTGGQETPVRHP
jgi:glycosyltransferase involved in cell wall biosynthesis